jgi:hypothetical protein
MQELEVRGHSCDTGGRDDQAEAEDEGDNPPFGCADLVARN